MSSCATPPSTANSVTLKCQNFKSFPPLPTTILAPSQTARETPYLIIFGPPNPLSAPLSLSLHIWRRSFYTNTKMQNFIAQSFFRDINSRELNGFRGSLNRGRVFLFFCFAFFLPLIEVLCSFNFNVIYFSPVKKRPYIVDERPESSQLGAVSVEHNGKTSPPMALSFCKVNNPSLEVITTRYMCVVSFWISLFFLSKYFKEILICPQF